MFRSFDAYGKFETPQLILCNPNGKELSVISHALHIKADLRIGSYSELSFDVPMIANGKQIKYYKLLQKLRLVKVENYGVFVINDIKEHREYVESYKSISCKSIDALFATKSLVNVEGTYKLYDILGGESIMSLILAKMPDWKIGEFDADLMNTYRTYDLSEKNLYDLMMNDLSEDFQCVFTFDTFDKLINIKTTRNQIKKTDIFVSFENLLKEIEISPVTDSIKTSLEVYGADNLSIHEVNPLGGTIYNFDYFKTTEWLSQETIDAINVWEKKVETNRTPFANNLTQIKDLNTALIGYKIQLTDLEGELKALENVLSAQVTQGISTSTTLNSISSKNNEIDSKKSQISQTEDKIAILKLTNSTIQDDLKLNNNLSESQLLELMSISNTTGGTYTNDAFVKTSSMSNVEIQEEAQRLYDLALTVLEKESQPRYTFSANIINFLALEWAEKFSNQLALGCEFTVGIDDDTYFYPVLLEYSIDFDDIKNCTMTFSNNLRLSNNQFDFASLFDGLKSTVSSVSTSKGLWEDYIKSGDKDSLFNLKNDALDLATKTIKSTSGQDFTIDQTGIRGRKLLDGNVLSPNQLWMANNGIYMTTNNWQTSSLALGEITFNGIKKYGIVTELLVGNLVATETLIIKNGNGSFLVDGSSVTIKNGNILMTNEDGEDSTLEDVLGNIRSKTSKDLADAIINITTDIEDMGEALKDGMIETFYQPTTPSTAKLGDVWYDTSNKNKAYLYQKDGWKSIQDQNILDALTNAQNAQDTADGKITSYYCTKTELPKEPGEGDLWFDINEKNKPYVYRGVTWVSAQDGSIADAHKYANEALNKIESVTDYNGALVTEKLVGQILAGKNNIECIDSSKTKALKMNEVGLLIANTKTDGDWIWKTAITADGIVADAIKANGTISGCTLLGGSLNIGDGSFKVDVLGNCTASSLKLTGGSINVNNRFTVDEYGNSVASSLTISGGSINIGNNFKVDTSGNVTTAGNLILGGNINMTGKITWNTSSSPVKVQYSVDGSSNWHTNVTTSDKFARYSYDGGITWTSAIKIVGENGTNGSNGSDGKDGTDAFVPEYITQTYIDSVEIKSPTISGNVVNSATFNGGTYRTWASGVYGGQMDSMGLHVYDGTTQIGDFTYTNDNSNGNPNALLINSKSGYALKINSSNNMSMSATNIYLEGKVIINGKEYSQGGGTAVFG